MKPKFMLATLLLLGVGTTAFAQKNKIAQPSTTVNLNEAVTGLTINDNLTVVLTESAAAAIVVEGDARSVDVRFSDGHLTVATPAYVTKATVYVPAASLSKIFLNDNSTLLSASVLTQGKLKIIMGGEAKVNVRSTGGVVLEAVNDISIVTTR